MEHHLQTYRKRVTEDWAAFDALLEASKAAYIALPMTNANQETNNMLKAAIAKAEGRTP